MRRALLDVGGKLTRRSSLITSASMVTAARRGNDDAFFLWLSRAILTNEGLRTVYIEAMAKATARPGAEATLVRVLGPKPSWSDRYWKSVVSVPQSLVNASKLRILVAKAPWHQIEIDEADRVLALRLTQAGHFEAVRQLADGLGQGGLRPVGNGNIVTNPQFARPSLLPPIDWQLASSGNLGASIDVKRKVLSISAIAGARGYAARQLVELTPGNYRISWNLAANNASLERNVLTARLDCAEQSAAGAAGPAPIDLSVGLQHGNIAVPAIACRWYWLSINVNVSDVSSGFDAQLSHLRLARGDGESRGRE
ncbi:hypothetical protein [Sphingopyxis fribergensis]